MIKAMKIIEDALIKAAEKFSEQAEIYSGSERWDDEERSQENHRLMVMCQEALNQLTLIELGLKKSAQKPTNWMPEQFAAIDRASVLESLIPTCQNAETAQFINSCVVYIRALEGAVNQVRGYLESTIPKDDAIEIMRPFDFMPKSNVVKPCTRCEGTGNTLKGACVRCFGTGKNPVGFKTESDGV